MLFPRAGDRFSAGLCFHRRGGDPGGVRVTGLSALVFALQLFPCARAGKFPLLLALFALRLLALLPCTLALGAAAMEKSRALLLLSLGGGGKRARAVTYGGAYWYRFGVCCVCLLLAALIELWLVPQFLLLAAR